MLSLKHASCTVMNMELQAAHPHSNTGSEQGPSRQRRHQTPPLKASSTFSEVLWLSQRQFMQECLGTAPTDGHQPSRCAARTHGESRRGRRDPWQRRSCRGQQEVLVELREVCESTPWPLLLQMLRAGALGSWLNCRTTEQRGAKAKEAMFLQL